MASIAASPAPASSGPLVTAERPGWERWLGGYSAATQAAYRRDAQDWLVYCGRQGLDPLRSSRADVTAWIAELQDRGLLLRYLGDSLFRVGVGYGLAVVLGIPLGLLMGG